MNFNLFKNFTHPHSKPWLLDNVIFKHHSGVHLILEIQTSIHWHVTPIDYLLVISFEYTHVPVSMRYKDDNVRKLHLLLY